MYLGQKIIEVGDWRYTESIFSIFHSWHEFFKNQLNDLYYTGEAYLGEKKIIESGDWRYAESIFSIFRSRDTFFKNQPNDQ